MWAKLHPWGRLWPPIIPEGFGGDAFAIFLLRRFFADDRRGDIAPRASTAVASFAS